jgi:hypothetical protein
LNAQVIGIGIASVSWSLDGTSANGRTVRSGRRYVASLFLSPGRHKLTVTADFTRPTQTRPYTFHRTVSGCLAEPPEFTA